MANVDSVEKIREFVGRYQSFARSRSNLRLQQLTQSFGHLRTALEALADLDRRSQRRLASGFNLFRALQVQRNEVRTHSAFLAELLDPNGTHGQGSAFLDALLRYCRCKGGEFERFPRLDPPTTRVVWVVSCEKPVPEGRLDIVVQSVQLKFLMVIENKIGADEQQDQIGRYQTWLIRQKQYPPERRVLLYLTPEGRRANTAYSEDYFRFSYGRDVVAWLWSALPNVEAARVREAVVQYLDLVTGLFASGMEGET
jgi:hypothetical protein